MSESDVSPIPVVAAAVQVSESQETRDTANAAIEESAIAQATAEVAGNTALEAEEDAQTAAEVAVVSAEIGTEAAVSAEEAKQEAGQALSEVGQLREELLGRLDAIHGLLNPPQEQEPPADGVTEVELDGSDIGESGIEPERRSATSVSDSGAGSSGASDSGDTRSRTNSSRRTGLRRGRR